MTKLTPFDSELIVMVRNLTGKEPGVVEKENVYTLTVDMAGKYDDEKKAIDDAINGRIYPRLKRVDYTHYKGDIIEYDIMYNAEFEQLPVELRGEIEAPGYVEVGKRYCRKLKEVFAIQFTRENKDDVVKFSGNGIVEIPRTPNTLGKFTFANANGVFQQANESDVICTVDGNVFEVMRYSDFVAMYEPKDGNTVIDFLNEKFGTDIYMRCKKLNEEVNELFQVVRSSGAQVLTQLAYNIDFIDELADVAVVLNHIAGIAGFTNAELEKIALDKIKARENNPDYARRHPHTDTPDIRTKIAQKAFEVRQLQKAYFESRDKIILTRSKQEERELDAMLMQYIDPQK